MLKSIRARIALIVLIVGSCAWALLRMDDGSWAQNPEGDFAVDLNLGLDLQGGMYLALEVEDPLGTFTPEQKAQFTDQALTVLRARIDEFGVAEPSIQKTGDDRIIVELPGIDDQDRAEAIINQTAFLQWKLVRTDNVLTRDVIRRIDVAIVAELGEDSLRALGRAQRESGAAAATDPAGDILSDLLGDTTAVDTTQADTTQVDTTGVEADSTEAALEDEGQATDLSPFGTALYQGDRPGIYSVLESDYEVLRDMLSLRSVRVVLPRDVELAWDWQPTVFDGVSYRNLYVLEEDAVLNGDMLDDATAARDPQFNAPIVLFELNRAGGRIFGEFTAAHIDEPIAILLDGEVVTAPNVRDRIGRSGQIELGGSDMEEARDLAVVLRAGALPQPLMVLERRTVGPSLGQDSIDQSEMAGMVGLVLVVLIMIGYYRMAGLLSILALSVYVLMVLGGLSAIGATLTLPGMAGLILSVGMAVDANVLIFERIREELAAGRATRTAVDEGFGNALSAIVDANLTTLITALILFQFGTGPVQGFAVTLSIGIVASFFSALFVTRTFFLMYLSGKRASDPISI